MSRNFMQMLRARWAEGKPICVGLDTDPTKTPAFAGKPSERADIFLPLRASAQARNMLAFNAAIIEATHDLVCAYKPNLGFYLAYGSEGVMVLERTALIIKDVTPEVPIILDYKVGDIGNTNLGYIRFAFEVLGVDAVTVSPYVGQMALQPFLDREKGIFVLCRTSNDGADEFQNPNVLLDDIKEQTFLAAVGRMSYPGGGSQGAVEMFRHVAYRVATHWNSNGNCGLVVGATAPDELAQVRRIVGDMPILAPGVGAQGGDLDATVKAGGKHIIITESRSVLYASSGRDFAEAARNRVLATNAAIRRILQGEGR